MKEKIAAVHEFHTAFTLGIKNKPTADLGCPWRYVVYFVRYHH